MNLGFWDFTTERFQWIVVFKKNSLLGLFALNCSSWFVRACGFRLGKSKEAAAMAALETTHLYDNQEHVSAFLYNFYLHRLQFTSLDALFFSTYRFNLLECENRVVLATIVMMYVTGMVCDPQLSFKLKYLVVLSKYEELSAVVACNISGFLH